MRKNAAKANERRDFHAAQMPKKNNHGIDPSAFKNTIDVERAMSEMAMEKSDIEKQLSIIKSNISMAHARRSKSVVGMSQMFDQQARLKRKLQECEEKIAEIRMARINLREKTQEELVGVFFECAKQMLAHEVFQKVLSEALRRVNQ